MTYRSIFAVAVAAALVGIAGGAKADVNVVTHHYDNLRTGWNNAETILNPTNVVSAQFKAVHGATLDQLVNTQPLVVTHQAIKGRHGYRNVVYVVTTNNTVYAVDGDAGGVLLSRNLGTAVPSTALPGNCGNPAFPTGVTGTPVIDLVAKIMFVIADTWDGANQNYYLHVLNLTDLTDRVPPLLITASSTLSDNSTYNFNAAYSRQRPALMLQRGILYAGFSSFCDLQRNLTRGWLLAWQWKSGTLTPAGTADLQNHQATSDTNAFLTELWMSGAGPASDGSYIYFVTGNSDPAGTSYSSSGKTLNLAQSTVAMTLSLKTVNSFFTPFNYAALEAHDFDFGAGGILLIPDQPNTTVHLATAVGKAGQLFLINRLNMGGYSPPSGPDKVLFSYPPSGNPDLLRCWCAESYFVGSDGVGRVVTSGGIPSGSGSTKMSSNKIITWKISTANPNSPTLVRDQTGPTITSAQSPGMFTTVSSNGKNDGIIWAVGRPKNKSPAWITLLAFDANQPNLPLLANKVAGTWPFGNAIPAVPVVANGHVYVAANKTLYIFGLAADAVAVRAEEVAPPPPPPPPPAASGHQLYGDVVSFDGDNILMTTRTGHTVLIDAGDAFQNSLAVWSGEALQVQWDTQHGNTYHAVSVINVVPNQAMWGPDQ